MTIIQYSRCDAQCNARQSCPTKACCSQFGFCGFGPTFCGSGCQRDCDARPECGQYALPESQKCPLNVCCSQHGFCGTTSEFCDAGCQNGCGGSKMPQAGGGNGNVVGGYYASWASSRPCDAWTPSAIDPRTYTHLFYAFARISRGVMATPTSTEAADMRAFTALKSRNPLVKLLVSVGGWAFNDPGPTQREFHNIALSSASRARFISSALRFMNQYGFDGIDIDWEYPVAEERGGAPEDKNNYLLLVQEMRAVFGNGKLITIAAPASYWYLRHFLIGEMAQHLDFINLMTYDFHGVWNQNNVLGTKLRSQTDIRMIREALDLCARDSVPAGKIVIGIAYYGRSYTLASSSCTTIESCDFSGPGNPGRCTSAAGVLSWREIQNIATANRLTPILDTQSMSKILTWDNQWVSFDDEETHKFRRDFAKSNNLGGFMIWSIDQGTTGSQIEAMSMGEMKWYQCIQHPDHCCDRTSTFCTPDCGDCYFQDIIDDRQFFTNRFDSTANFVFPDWMSQLNDNLRLTEMSIPGTHDSAARNIIEFAECQTMSIRDQLYAGIRAIDARCRHIDDVFAMHHGSIYLDLAFGDVLDICCDFLKENPREMIIMRVKEEHDSKDVSRSFQETLQEHYINNENWSPFIDTSPELGTLGDHRGKILFLNNHKCTNGNFGYCWGFSKPYTQDFYDLPVLAPPFTETYAEWKMEKVKENLLASSDDNDNLYINFSSGQKAVLLTPAELAMGSKFRGVNELVTNFLVENPTACKKTGLFMMDYPGSALIYQILLRN